MLALSVLLFLIVCPFVAQNFEVSVRPIVAPLVIIRKCNNDSHYSQEYTYANDEASSGVAHVLTSSWMGDSSPSIARSLRQLHICASQARGHLRPYFFRPFFLPTFLLLFVRMGTSAPCALAALRDAAILLFRVQSGCLSVISFIFCFTFLLRGM